MSFFRSNMGTSRDDNRSTFKGAIEAWEVAHRLQETKPQTVGHPRVKALPPANEWGLSLRCPHALVPANFASSGRTRELRRFGAPIGARRAIRKSLLCPRQSADSVHGNHLL